MLLGAKVTPSEGLWRTTNRKLEYPRDRPKTRPFMRGYAILDTPLAFEDLQREIHQRVFRFVMQLRFVIGPLPVLVGGYVFITDPTLWRRAALVGTLGLAILLGLVYRRRVRRQQPVSLEAVMLLVGLVLHPVVFIATGGIVSPVLLGMLLVCFGASTLLSRRASGILLATQILSLFTASMLEYWQPFGSLVPIPFRTVVPTGPTPALLVVYSAVATLLFVVARELGTRIQFAFAEMLGRTIEAREQSLLLHREQLAELTLLSGEIAHELKNPLASVKGLAALLARRSEGQEPEPLVVLRREVDRMQGILEEFLNFSRPLVPLNLTDVRLDRISEEVILMHEGLSALREVHVELVESPPIVIRCDPRKLRQILVNLLQNALDASTEGGHVWVRLHAQQSAVEVVIEDDGRGLEPTTSGRVFEAGVTTKPEGSGLGLNVARGLARQHGGEVTLESSAPRGCTATLRLPTRSGLGEDTSSSTPRIGQSKEIRGASSR